MNDLSGALRLSVGGLHLALAVAPFAAWRIDSAPRLGGLVYGLETRSVAGGALMLNRFSSFRPVLACFNLQWPGSKMAVACFGLFPVRPVRSPKRVIRSLALFSVPGCIYGTI